MIKQYFQRKPKTTSSSTNTADIENPPRLPPPKRRRLNDSSSSPKPRAQSNVRTIADSDGEDEVTDDGNEREREGEDAAARKTDLESALPAVPTTDREAIEAYEAFKASQTEDDEERRKDAAGDDNAEARLEGRKWVRGQSSIYVDAFNLALDTVLEEESHLFDEAEREVLAVWKGLGYEAQYLYVPFHPENSPFNLN